MHHVRQAAENFIKISFLKISSNLKAFQVDHKALLGIYPTNTATLL